MSPRARDERIRIRNPFRTSQQDHGAVVLRPVPMEVMADLVAPKGFAALRPDRDAFARRLIAM